MEDDTVTKPPPFLYFDCFDRLEPLKCTSCAFSTESLLLLRYHLDCRHHDQQQFALKATLKTCKKCGFCTHSNYLWIGHRTFGTCKDKKNTKRERVSRQQDGKWHFCEKCSYRTVDMYTLKNHVINNHTPLEAIDWQQCTQCPAKFKTVKILKQHLRRVHLVAVDRLHCTECDYSTPSKHDLGRHFNRKHAQAEEIKWVECHECGAKFKDKGNLNFHLKRHTSKKYECDQCPFKAYRKDSLKKHIMNRHLKDLELLELVQCPHCDFKTRGKKWLKVHFSAVHDDSARNCDLCDYQSKHKKNIQMHKKNKHGVGDVTWLKCEHCDFSSKYKQNLKNHVLVKHNKDKNAKVFHCKQCEYKTVFKDYLTNHITKMHKRPKVAITCENCSFVTTTERQLRRHMFNKHTVHTEEEKLNCDHCTYVCFSKEYLTQHLKFKHKIGDKIRWYECDKCDFKNRYKRSLDRHMNNIHNEGKILECEQCAFTKVGKGGSCLFKCFTIFF